MEAFSLLKYWRGGGVTGNNARTLPGTTTIVEAVKQPAVETDDDDDDDGSFFDLEFMPDDDDGEGEDDHGSDEEVDSNSGVDEEDDGDSSTGTDGEREFNFTVSSGSSGGKTDPNLSLSPSDDLFFKGRLVPFEPSSLDFNPSEPNSKSQFPVSLLKSATKFRVFTLGFRKPKSTTSEKSESSVTAAAAPKQNQLPQTKQHRQGKFLTVKLKVEEVPIASLFTRDNSSRSSGNKLQKQNSDEAVTDDKRFSKDVVQKYLKMIKPLYVKVSRRYGEKLKFSGQLSLGLGKATPAPVPAPAPTISPVSSPKTTKNNQGEAEETEAQCSFRSQKQGSLPAGLRVVCKHLGKSRSASSAVAAAPTLPVQSSRRDDSLLQQQDGIQGAILHCKRSFNAKRDLEISMLSRCTSDPSHEKSISSCRNSSDLSNEKAISSYRISSEEGSVAHARI
ncbi:probable membrane-associated kinase regulator 2 [Telopea speciosissima]|uniref:probable membrane-associated kinase regulator 2 n=1 Tax=Telopea speciosissima TaxID=54955 RepID=UPI001CC3C883|nr:probable membrane-associated kinase regulator 2 [Telopea speciosissima]